MSVAAQCSTLDSQFRGSTHQGRIMRNQPGEATGSRKKEVFRTAIILAFVAPFGVAVVATERLDVQPSSSQIVPFDAAAVKMNKSSSERGLDKISPGGRFTATNLTVAAEESDAAWCEVVERDYRPRNRERIDTTQLAALPQF